MTVTLAGMATYLGISATDTLYPQLQGVLNATLEVVASKVGSRGTSPTFTVFPEGRALILPVSRVGSVDTITDPGGTEVDLTLCVVDAQAGLITLPFVATSGYQTAYTVVVTLADSPAVDEATLIIGKHLWESRRGNRGVASGAYGQDVDMMPVGFAIPRRAAELLNQYTLPGSA